MPRKTPTRALPATPAPLVTPATSDQPWNSEELFEVEHFDLRKFIWILHHWNQLGPSVGKAYVNGEIVDNEAFYTIVKSMISDCESTREKFPTGDYQTSYRQGSLGFGRFIATKTSLINIARPVRHTICEGLYQDIDFVNCHLYIYKFLCNSHSVECQVIDDYINQRESHLEALCKANPGLTRDNAKQAFLSILNGGQCWSIPTFTPFFQHYYDQFHSRIHLELVAHIEQKYPALRSHVVKKYGASAFNLNCKIISKVLEDYENRMRHFLCEFVKSKGFDFSSHCYDGGMSYLPLNPLDIRKHLNLEEASYYIASKVGIWNPLKFKDFDQGLTIPLEQLHQITFDDFVSIKNEHAEDYDSVKYRFEKGNFFCLAGARYYSLDHDDYVYYSKDVFMQRYDNLYYQKQEKEKITRELFVPRWIRDEKKRSYKNVVFVPRGGSCHPQDFNLWKGFRVERIHPDGSDHSAQLQIILDHLKFLANHEDPIYLYLLQWFACLFQFPHRKTEVLVGIKSLVQGVGKSLLFVLMTEMMGPDLTAKIENPERDLFGDFNELIMNKLFILLEEWDSTVNLKYAKRILDMITSTVDNINLKGGKKFSNPSYTNFVSVWNRSGLRFEENDRRMFATEVKCKQAPSREYFDTFVSCIKQPQALRAFYDYLMSLDLTEFHPSRCRPHTSLRDEILSMTRDKLELWLVSVFFDKRNYLEAGNFPSGKTRALYERDGIIILTDKLFDEFVIYLKRFGYSDYKVTYQSFTKRLKALQIEGFGPVKSHGSSAYALHIDRMTESLINLNWISRNDLEHPSSFIDSQFDELDISQND